MLVGILRYFNRSMAVALGLGRILALCYMLPLIHFALDSLTNLAPLE